jgi:hypothetical protein
VNLLSLYFPCFIVQTICDNTNFVKEIYCYVSHSLQPEGLVWGYFYHFVNAVLKCYLFGKQANMDISGTQTIK